MMEENEKKENMPAKKKEIPEKEIEQDEEILVKEDEKEKISVEIVAKSGRQYKIPIDTQLKEYRLKSKELLDSNNKILPATATIYKNISEKFENKMTPKAIQIVVTKHAEEIFGQNVVHKTEAVQCEEIIDINDDFGSYDSDALTVLFTIDQKHSDTFAIVIVESKSGKRSYKVLRPGWTDALHDIIIAQTGTHCVFQFLRSNIVGEEFVAVANCSECGCSIKVTSFENRKKISLEMIRGPGEHTYAKRRRLTTARAKSLIPALKADTVYNVHSDLVNEYDPESEFVPRNYVSKKALENVKHQYINKRNNSIAALRDMKYQDYSEIIKEIGTDPFFIIFYTPAQKFVYMQYAKKGRIVLGIDATGGLISNKQLVADLSKNVHLPHIFLYLICLKLQDGRSVPLAQFLSAEHDTTKIKYFLQRFTEDFGYPDEIILDEGTALQKACAQIFASSDDIADYVKKCFAILNSDDSNLYVDRPLKTFIRNDVSHFVLNVHKNKVFNNIGVQAKHFYKCVIGTIMQTESYEQIKMIVKHLLILANYPIEGTLDDATEVPTKQSRISLQRLIRTHDTSFLSSEMEESDSGLFLNETNDAENCNITSEIGWYSELLNEIQHNAKLYDCAPSNLSSNVSINNYQCIEMNLYMHDLLSKLPLWSCVMCTHFQAPNLLGNSCNVESYYSLLKNNIFHLYTLPVSPVVFIEILVKRINSVTTLMKMFMKQSAHLENDDVEKKTNIAEISDMEMHETPKVSNISSSYD